MTGGVRFASSFGKTGLDARGWNALARLGTNTVFQTYEWQSSWWAAYGGRFEPLFITVTNGASTCGVAPLIVEQGVSGRVVRFIGDGRADYCDVLAGNNWGTVARIVAGLKDYGDWDVLDLTNVPSQSGTVGMLKALCEDAGFGVMVHDYFTCPTLLIHGHEHAAERILSKPSLRRRINYFERIGRLTIRDLTAASDVAPCLEGFFAQHVTRWQAHNTPSLFNDPVNQTFYRELTDRMGGTGWLLFSSVELEGRPIAMHFGFDYDDGIIWYKPSFDPAFAAGSPGLVLVRHLIHRALREGRRELDFTIGDEPFKRRFTNHVRKTVHIQVYRDPARYLLERSRRGVMAAVRRAAARMRQL
jgi:CelD/BcsL family acetyltransferase involved in cellulose biosynthesis